MSYFNWLHLPYTQWLYLAVMQRCRFSQETSLSYHSEGASNINALGVLQVRLCESLALTK